MDKLSYYQNDDGSVKNDILETLKDAAITKLDRLISKELLEARVELAALRAERQWVSVEDRLPEEGKTVTVDFGDNEISVGSWFWEDVEHDEHETNPDLYVQWQCWNFGSEQFRYCDAPVSWLQLLPAPAGDTN